MKVLLINPPITIFPGAAPTLGGLPLGLMYLAAMAEKAGYEAQILDAQREIGWKDIKNKIQDYKPDVVGIGNAFSVQIENAIEISKVVRSINPDILTVIGGPHVSVFPAKILSDNPTLDIAVRGEGEITFFELLKCYAGNRDFSAVDGISYRQNNIVRVNKAREYIADLDIIPFPAYHLVDMPKYLDEKNAVKHHDSEFSGGVPIITSRGCPFNCIFCSIHLHMGRKYRPHSPQYVIDHLKLLVTKYGAKYFHFEDDNFTFDLKRCEAILDGIIADKLKIHWDTPNGVRADFLTGEILIKMKKSGCKELRIAPESGSQKIINEVIGKKLDLNSIVFVAKMCREIGIKLRAFFIIGLPGEKKEDIKKTMSFAHQLENKYGVIPTFSLATPLFGTRLYEICKENNYLVGDLSPDNLGGATSGWGVIKTRDFSPQDLKRYIRRYRLEKLIYKLLNNPFWVISKLLKRGK